MEDGPPQVRIDALASAAGRIHSPLLDAEDVPGLATLLATNLAAEADRYGLAAAPSDA